MEIKREEKKKNSKGRKVEKRKQNRSGPSRHDPDPVINLSGYRSLVAPVRGRRCYCRPADVQREYRKHRREV